MIAKHPKTQVRHLACDVTACPATFPVDLDPRDRARARAAKVGWTVGRYELRLRDLCPAHVAFLDAPAPKVGDLWLKKGDGRYGLRVDGVRSSLERDGHTVTTTVLFQPVATARPDLDAAPMSASLRFVQARYRLAERPEGTPVPPPAFKPGRGPR